LNTEVTNVIRLATFEPLDPKGLEKLQKTLYTAFGVGCEHSGDVDLPSGFKEPLDAPKLLKDAPYIRAYADDKLLYLTTQKLKERVLPSGTGPTVGYCLYTGSKALVTLTGFSEQDNDVKRAGRRAMHQLGHLWELHHCLDPRCAMYPHWTLGYDAADATFCNFCRDKSEQKIRLAKS
jgi:predicted Zn-dependent protease